MLFFNVVSAGFVYTLDFIFLQGFSYSFHLVCYIYFWFLTSHLNPLHKIPMMLWHSSFLDYWLCCLFFVGSMALGRGIDNWSFVLGRSCFLGDNRTIDHWCLFLDVGIAIQNNIFWSEFYNLFGRALTIATPKTTRQASAIRKKDKSHRKAIFNALSMISHYTYSRRYSYTSNLSQTYCAISRGVLSFTASWSGISNPVNRESMRTPMQRENPTKFLFHGHNYFDVV